EEQQVSFTISKEELSFFDDTKHSWIAEPGIFEALVGASSTDIRSKISFELK
ncbi:MAG: bglB 2, partial [Bacteroidetes bacterium]|nr:bglB 2 [Bacteroidota bacterium]